MQSFALDSLSKLLTIVPLEGTLLALGSASPGGVGIGANKPKVAFS